MMFNSILPNTDNHPPLKMLLRPGQITSKQPQEYINFEKRKLLDTQYINAIVNKTLQDQIRRRKVLSATLNTAQDHAITFKLNDMKTVEKALVAEGASNVELCEHIEKEKNKHVFECGRSSRSLIEQVNDIIDVNTAKDEDSRVDATEAGKYPFSEFTPGKVTHGNFLAMLDLLSKHGNDWSKEETGIVLSRAFWFLHSDERQKILKIEELGRGSFGVVELYQHNKTIFVKKQVKQYFQVNEVYMTAILDSPYVIKTFGFICQLDTKTIIMEYWGFSLLKHSKQRKFTEEELWNLMFQGVSGLTFLDKCGIIHHDIKPENMLLQEINGTLQLKIADFGAAKWSGQPNDIIGWTPEYLSPERAWFWLLKVFPQLIPNGNEDDVITGKSDVLSLGLTICYPYNGSHVMLKYITQHKDISNEDQINAAKRDTLLEIVGNPQLVVDWIPSSADTKMKPLLSRMLAPFEERVTAEEARDLMLRFQSQPSLAETLPSSNVFRRPKQGAVMSHAVFVDNSAQEDLTSSRTTQEVVRSPIVTSQLSQQQQHESKARCEAKHESEGRLQHITKQTRDFNSQPEQTISLSKSLRPEKIALLPQCSEVIQKRLISEPSTVSITDSKSSTLGRNWKTMTNTITSDNMKDFPGGFKSRLIKRKLYNKLPDAKKQKLHEESKISKRTGRQHIVHQRKIAVESVPTTASDDNTKMCGGNMPYLDLLLTEN